MTYETAHEQQLKQEAIVNNDIAIEKAQAQGNISNTAFGNLVNNGPVIKGLADKLEVFLTEYVAGLSGNPKAAFGASFEYLITPDFKFTKPNGDKVFFTFNEKCQKLVVIGLSASLNCIFSKDANDALFSNISVVIGQAVEQEAKFNSFKTQNEWLFNATWDANLKDPLFGEKYALEQMTSYLESKDLVAGVDWNLSGSAIYAKVGAIILNTIVDGLEVPLFTTETVVKDGNNAVAIAPTELLMKDVDQLASVINDRIFAKKPMLQTPNPWTEDSVGGYALNGSAVNLPLIRQKPGFEVGSAGPVAINMINNLQEVPLKVNPEIFKVATQCMEKGISLGSFTSIKKKCSAAERRLSTRKSVPCRASLDEAGKFLDSDQFFLPWSMDSRGRVYPQASTLNTQSTDFGKSLVMFAEPGEFNESAKKWLAVHLANCWGNGVDKRSLKERHDWVKSAGKVIIKKVIENPLAAIKSWTKDGNSAPSEPWQFIAAAFEWHGCVISGKQKTTSIMCATDATCSGLQMLTGLMLDEQASTFVNVQSRPDGSIGDAYTACAELAVNKYVKDAAIELQDTTCIEEIKELLSGKSGRKFSKKVVMTTPYNSNEHTQAGEIVDLFKELNITITKPNLQARIMARALRSALKELMPNVINGMEQISQAVFNYVKEKQLKSISWTSPSGFKVVQSKFEIDSKRIKLLGSNQTVAIETILWDKNNPLKHKTSTAPNLVHSIDSACLHIAFEKADYPFSLIHDSVLTRACDMEAAVAQVKQTFADVFSQDVLGKFSEEVGMEVPVAKGNLDVNCVLDSEFYFS